MRYLVFTLLIASSPAWAESMRIEVYPLSQSYWDVKQGETLGEIVNTLIPHNRHLQGKLMREIVSLNPDGNPHLMLADRRLWLPNAVKDPGITVDAGGYSVESFQWGSIKRRVAD